MGLVFSGGKMADRSMLAISLGERNCHGIRCYSRWIGAYINAIMVFYIAHRNSAVAAT